MTTRRSLFTALAAGWGSFRFAFAGEDAGGARPKEILIIRHGEKTGIAGDIHLNARGYERAAALPRLFPAKFTTPTVLLATKATAKSNRPVETIAPLAAALQLKIEDRFANEESAALAKEMFSNAAYANQVVLISWHHGKIPELARALGVGGTLAAWPDAQFDRVWQLRFVEGRLEFADLPQKLLAGDSAV